MNLLTLINEDITELLIKIIKFTYVRQKTLILNITNCHNPGFIPKDLEVDEFCNLLNAAIDEHIQNQRLVFSDTQNIKLDINGCLQVKSLVDESARQLLEEDQDEYIKSQISKLFENSLNQRLAAELLRQRQGATTIGYRTITYCDH